MCFEVQCTLVKECQRVFTINRTGFRVKRGQRLVAGRERASAGASTAREPGAPVRDRGHTGGERQTEGHRSGTVGTERNRGRERS